MRIVRLVEEAFHRDDEDRPLREIRTPPAYLRAGDIEHKACPYAGSRARSGCPINVGALRQASAHWPELIDALALVRTLHRDARGAGPATLMDLWRVSQLGAALPWFYLLRARGAAPAPAFAAALAKACQGTGVWAQRVLADELAGAPPSGAWTAEAILASSERTGTLVGEVEACAGPEAMLRRCFAALVDGAPTLAHPAVAALAVERDALLGFGAHYANWKLVLWLHALARQFVYADLLLALGHDHALAAPIAALAAAGDDPPDFVRVAPADPAAVSLPSRVAWLTQVASRVVPFAPDGSDRALTAAALAIARVSGVDDFAGDLHDEVAAVARLGAPAAALAARALMTYARLDAILGVAAAAVEAGFARADGDDRPVARLDAATRDRLLSAPPRAALTALAPRTLAALAAR